MDLKVIWRFETSVNSPVLLKREPQLDLVAHRFGSSLISTNGGLNVDSATITLGVDFEHSKFFMHKIISDKGTRLAWKISPRLYFNWLRFGHVGAIYKKSNKYYFNRIFPITMTDVKKAAEVYDKTRTAKTSVINLISCRVSVTSNNRSERLY